MRKIITDVPKLVKEYESGLNSQQLADKYHTSRNVICDALKRGGCKRRDYSEAQKGKISPKRIIKDLPKLIEEYKSGLSTVKLGEKYNTSSTVINGWLRYAGCPRRSLSEAHADFSGENHPNYKGTGINLEDGTYLCYDGKGYLRRKCKGHPLADRKSGYIGEHVYQACLKWGINEVKGKEVHHINEIKDDNRIENLIILTKGEHRLLHNLINNDYSPNRLKLIVKIAIQRRNELKSINNFRIQLD